MAASRGFSLVEVLVALTLASLLLGSLYSAFGAVGRTNRAVVQLQRGTQDRRLVLSAVSELFANAVPLTERRGDRTHVLFEGTRSSARFVSHLPAHAGGGGLQFIEFRAESAFGGSRRSSLLLLFRSAWPDVEFDVAVRDAAWSREVLLTDIDGITFEYFGTDDARSAPTWRDSWRSAERLPQLVRVAVTADGAWPELVVPLRAEVSEAMPNWHRELPAP